VYHFYIIKIFNFFRGVFKKKNKVVQSSYNFLTKLDALYAEDIMIERSKIFALDVNTPKNGIISAINSRQNSRIPIYEKNLDKIIGFIHIKDIIRNIEKDFKISDIIRNIIFIPPEMRVSAVLFRMKSYQVHAAIVVDEFGCTAGLVTMTDIVEEILGEINDEHDKEISPSFIKISDSKFEVSARLELKDFTNKSGIKIRTSDNFRTIGGYIFSITGKVPNAKEKITAPNGIEFFILDADNKKINNVIIDIGNIKDGMN
jgi:CBS domain containing-hemolysin-like protein